MNRKGVTPVVATILLVVIAIILSVTIYALVGGIGNNIEPQQMAGVILDDTPDGLSWSIMFVTVPPALPLDSVSLVLNGFDGKSILSATLLSDLNGTVRFSSSMNDGTLHVGDRIVIDKDLFPGDFRLFTDKGLLAQGVF